MSEYIASNRSDKDLSAISVIRATDPTSPRHSIRGQRESDAIVSWQGDFQAACQSSSVRYHMIGKNSLEAAGGVPSSASSQLIVPIVRMFNRRIGARDANAPLLRGS